MRLRITYIDDEPDLCQMFFDNFDNELFAVMTFTDPSEGVDAVLKDEPDLVVLDYRFPNTSGYEVAAMLPVHIPIALVSGDLSLKSGSRFLKVFGKPFDFDEMRQFLSSFQTNNSVVISDK